MEERSNLRKEQKPGVSADGGSCKLVLKSQNQAVQDISEGEKRWMKSLNPVKGREKVKRQK